MASPAASVRDCIAVGSDHGGFALKEHLKTWLDKRGQAVVDAGAFDEKPVDYPVVAAAVARKVQSGECRRGIIVDGAGIGSAMVANKLAGVRAALCYDVSSARNAREHNDANVLSLGARVVNRGAAVRLARLFLTTAFAGGRHERRVAKIMALEGPR